MIQPSAISGFDVNFHASVIIVIKLVAIKRRKSYTLAKLIE